MISRRALGRWYLLESDMGWMSNSLEKRGVDPCPKFGDGVTEKTETRNADESKLVTHSKTRNAGNKPAKEKGKRGPSAKHASAAERQKAYRARKRGRVD
jgi:hypothetical protein